MRTTTCAAIVTTVLAVGCAHRSPIPVDDRFRVGAGPEDLVVASWPYAPSGTSNQVAITSLADRRRPTGRPVQGFTFIRLENGTPRPFGGTPHLPAGIDTEAPPWQGLYWQPHADFAGGRGVLAATRTMRWIPAEGWRNAGGYVDFFTWSNAPTATPTLVFDSRTDELRGPEGPSFNFNSVALTRDGTVYASVMSICGNAAATTIAEPTRHDPLEAVEPGAVYAWRKGRGWRLVARVKGANGLALSPDERTLYVNSAGTGASFAFGIQQDRLVAKPDGTAWLGANAAPDNLKLLDDGRLVALVTPRRISTGAYLLMEHYCGWSFAHPTGEVWTWNPADPERTKRLEFAWPNDYVGPSTTIRLGDWWLGGQMFDDAIAVRRVGDAALP